jgi:hypothetical protein
MRKCVGEGACGCGERAQRVERGERGFANERKALENQRGRGDNVSTEDLRVALKRYRSFFERLLAV